MKASEEAIKETVGAVSFSGEFILFSWDSRFHYYANIRLAYFLSYAQRASISEIARVLGINRRIIRERVLLGNPCFTSSLVEHLTKDQGSHQNRVILSDQAKLFISDIQASAFLRLGAEECSRLRQLAEVARRGAIKEGARKSDQEKYTLRITTLRRLKLRGDPRLEQFVNSLIKDLKIPREQIMKDLQGVPA